VFTLHIENLRALRAVHWSPAAVCALVGANGSGKTTLLLSLKFLRAAFDRGVSDAFALVLGRQAMRSWGADDSAPVVVGLDLGDLSWRLSFSAPDFASTETLHADGHLVFSRDAFGNIMFEDQRLSAKDQLGLRALVDYQRATEPVTRMASFLRTITVFHDPDLWGLRTSGSRSNEDRHLSSRGINAFTILRKWNTQREHRDKFAFVLDGLRAAFPELCSDLDFEEAGQTVYVRTYKPRNELPTPISLEANGLLAMLVLLCDVAAADRGSIVAIDEPENALHPFAVREFLRRVTARARHQDLTVLLASHSPVVLDEFNGIPHQVFLMLPDAGKSPIAVTDRNDPEWLARFRLGELYTNNALGSNAPSE
jgi:predicted ATPase